MLRAARQEEDDEEKIQGVTDALAAAKAISMRTLTSEPGGVFMLKGKEKTAPKAFFCVKYLQEVSG